MAPDSRRLKPQSLAAMAQGRNLARKETTHNRIVYPQVMPLFKRPKFVLRPERVKYWKRQVSRTARCYSLEMNNDRIEFVTYQRKEKNGNEILELLYQRDRKTIVVRNDQTSDKPA